VKTERLVLNPAWVALVEILARIEQQPYHWPIGRTLFQKIAYVATNEGLPTGLHYQRSSFGPFSGDLNLSKPSSSTMACYRKNAVGRCLW
jgi:uncharacterized protein YwgA